MRATLPLLLGILALCITQALHADDKIVVMVPAILDPAAPIAEGVRQSCSVETSVGNQVFLRVSERFPGTDRTSDSAIIASDKIVLKVTILVVKGVGGGGWSGTKSITIRIDALRHAKVILTQTLRRGSSGGVLGGVSGTCPIMDRIAVALGKDVVSWLPGALMAASYETLPAGQTGAKSAQDEVGITTISDPPADAPKQ